MANEAAAIFSVTCPCCTAELVIDPATRPVLLSAPALAPPPITALAAEVSRLRAGGAQREQAFQRSLESQRTREERMDRTFDELLRRAKQTPDERPLKDIDL